MSELLHITIFNQYQFQYTILISIMDVPTIADAFLQILRTFTEEDDVDLAVEAQDEEKGENAEDDDEDGFDLISKMYIKSSTRKTYNSQNKIYCCGFTLLIGLASIIKSKKNWMLP